MLQHSFITCYIIIKFLLLPYCLVGYPFYNLVATMLILHFGSHGTHFLHMISTEMLLMGFF